MTKLNVEHVLMLAIVAFVLYHFMGSCGCSGNGFSVGGKVKCENLELVHGCNKGEDCGKSCNKSDNEEQCKGLKYYANTVLGKGTEYRCLWGEDNMCHGMTNYESLCEDSICSGSSVNIKYNDEKQFTINNGEVLQINDGEVLQIENGYTIYNVGKICIGKNATIIIDKGGNLSNEGRLGHGINFLKFGKIYNNGDIIIHGIYINSNDSITINDGTILNNGQLIDLDGSGCICGSGKITGAGKMLKTKQIKDCNDCKIKLKKII